MHTFTKLPMSNVFSCSLPQRGSIGDRMFTGGWQLTLMKRMKKRLTETADHYRSLACQLEATATTGTTTATTTTTTTTTSTATTTTTTASELYERLDRLYRTLSYWLDEPRLHDPSLYVPALPADYQPQLLVTVFQSQSVCAAPLLYIVVNSSSLSRSVLLLCFILLLTLPVTVGVCCSSALYRC